LIIALVVLLKTELAFISLLYPVLDQQRLPSFSLIVFFKKDSSRPFHVLRQVSEERERICISDLDIAQIWRLHLDSRLLSVKLNDVFTNLCSFVYLGKDDRVCLLSCDRVFSGNFRHADPVAFNLGRCAHPGRDIIASESLPVSLLKVVPPQLYVLWVLLHVLTELLPCLVIDVGIEVSFLYRVDLEWPARNCSVRQ